MSQTMTELESPLSEPSYDDLMEDKDPFAFKCGASTFHGSKRDADAYTHLGFKSIEDLYQQSTFVQDNTPISQVVYLVRRDMHALEAKMAKKDTEIVGLVEAKTSFLEGENVRKSNAMEELYDIARSLDSVAVEVSFYLYWTKISR